MYDRWNWSKSFRIFSFVNHSLASFWSETVLVLRVSSIDLSDKHFCNQSTTSCKGWNVIFAKRRKISACPWRWVRASICLLPSNSAQGRNKQAMTHSTCKPISRTLVTKGPLLRIIFSTGQKSNTLSHRKMQNTFHFYFSQIEIKLHKWILMLASSYVNEIQIWKKLL